MSPLSLFSFSFSLSVLIRRNNVLNGKIHKAIRMKRNVLIIGILFIEREREGIYRYRGNIFQDFFLSKGRNTEGRVIGAQLFENAQPLSKME